MPFHRTLPGQVRAEPSETCGGTCRLVAEQLARAWLGDRVGGFGHLPCVLGRDCDRHAENAAAEWPDAAPGAAGDGPPEHHRVSPSAALRAPARRWQREWLAGDGAPLEPLSGSPHHGGRALPIPVPQLGDVLAGGAVVPALSVCPACDSLRLCVSVSLCLCVSASVSDPRRHVSGACAAAAARTAR